MSFDFVDYVRRHGEFSDKTFGKGITSSAVIKHIRKEIDEVEACPTDVLEWADIIILAIDGARRIGYTGEEIAIALELKFSINKDRDWPNPTEAPTDEPIEHIKPL